MRVPCAAVAGSSDVSGFSGLTELCRIVEQAVSNAEVIQITPHKTTNFRLTLLMSFVRITKRQGEAKMGSYRDSRHKFDITRHAPSAYSRAMDSPNPVPLTWLSSTRRP